LAAYASQEHLESIEDQQYERASDIDLDADYSDDDDVVPFKTAKEVINYLHNLEDDNLFKVGVL